MQLCQFLWQDNCVHVMSSGELFHLVVPVVHLSIILLGLGHCQGFCHEKQTSWVQEASKKFTQTGSHHCTAVRLRANCARK
jgi:hypothetical protein